MTDYRQWQPPELPSARVRTIWPTPRQVDVLHGLCLGLSNQQIGQRLFLAEDTIKTHVKRLFAHARTSSRAELVALIYSDAIRVMEPHNTREQP